MIYLCLASLALSLVAVSMSIENMKDEYQRQGETERPTTRKIIADGFRYGWRL